MGAYVLYVLPNTFRNCSTFANNALQVASKGDRKILLDSTSRLAAGSLVQIVQANPVNASWMNSGPTTQQRSSVPVRWVRCSSCTCI